MTLTDGYGRDLQWLRNHRPSKAPSRLQRVVNIFWPLCSVELWNSWVSMEKIQAEIDAAEIAFLHRMILAK